MSTSPPPGGTGAADNLRTIAHRWVEMARWDKAEPAIRSLLAQDPNDIDAHDLLCVVLIETGDPLAAREVVQRWLELAPTHSRAHAILALVMHAAADDPAAIAAANQAVRLAPDGSFERGVLASVMLGAGDSQGAMRVALEALERSPFEFNALRTLAWASLENNRPDLAEVRGCASFVTCSPAIPPTPAATSRSARPTGTAATPPPRAVISARPFASTPGSTRCANFSAWAAALTPGKCPQDGAFTSRWSPGTRMATRSSKSFSVSPCARQSR
jgi:predicted Zn-dependent protease